MKVKINELTGHALDWAVAKCEGENAELNRDEIVTWKTVAFEEYRLVWNPSTNWAQGGVIIERECIELTKGYGIWGAQIRNGEYGEWCEYEGSTPLVASMRCYVASKLGDEVDIPDDVFKQEHV